MMATNSGFWSYVHADDNAEGGRITRLARDVAAQYEMITGESIGLFLDQDHLEWGDEWEPKIDSFIGAGAFFIPIITPRYFQSRECRHELRLFSQKASQLGVQELVMPIRYIDFFCPKRRSLHRRTYSVGEIISMGDMDGSSIF